MTNASIVTVTDFQALAPEVDTTRYDNPTISGILSQASQVASDILGFNPMLEVIVDEVKEGRITTEGDLLVFPAKVPIVSVQGITLNKGPVSVSVGLTDGNGNNRYNIDYSQRHIRYPYNEITLNGSPVFVDFYSLKYTQFYVKLSYTAGWSYTNLPGSIKQATILLARDIFSNQYNQMGASRITQGSLTIEYKTNDPQGKQRSKLVADAYRLLAPYRKMV